MIDYKSKKKKKIKGGSAMVIAGVSVIGFLIFTYFFLYK